MDKNETKTLNVRVIPNSSKTELIDEGEILKLKVCAAPVEGKANKAVIEFFSKHFKVSKSRVKIIKGEKSKNKTVLINF